MKQTKIFAPVFLIFLPLIFFQGCNSCTKIFAKPPKNQEVSEKKTSLFTLSPELLAARARAGTYAYRSRLSLTLNNQERKLVNNELVEIITTPERMYVAKKIDGSHFLEIMSDAHNFYVKNRTGDWRSGNRNKRYYQALIGDALNVLSWLNTECMLEEHFVKHGKFFEIINQPLPQNAPLRALLQDKTRESLVNGHIEVDEENIPLSALLTISASKNSDFEFKLELEVKLSHDSNTPMPDLPILARDDKLLYPVNITARFKNLFDSFAQQPE